MQTGRGRPRRRRRCRLRHRRAPGARASPWAARRRGARGAGSSRGSGTTGAASGRRGRERRRSAGGWEGRETEGRRGEAMREDGLQVELDTPLHSTLTPMLRCACCPPTCSSPAARWRGLLPTHLQLLDEDGRREVLAEERCAGAARRAAAPRRCVRRDGEARDEPATCDIYAKGGVSGCTREVPGLKRTGRAGRRMRPRLLARTSRRRRRPHARWPAAR